MLEYIVLLGNNTVEISKKRADRVIEYLNHHITKNIIVICSGGTLLEETTKTESEYMKDLITNKSDVRIILENESRNTYENLQNSKTIIFKEQDKNQEIILSICTSKSHIQRACLLSYKIFRYPHIILNYIYTNEEIIPKDLELETNKIMGLLSDTTNITSNKNKN